MCRVWRSFLPELPASAFYTGLVADLYAPLKSTSYDAPRYRELIRLFGEPALELGCGDGDPLLDLRATGLDVDGVDSSPDMIERLGRRAAERNLTVDAWVDPMETLRTRRTYRTIFLAGPTFNLLPDDQAMQQTLCAVRRALAAQGTAVIPLFVPEPVKDAELDTPTCQETPTGSISVRITRASRDPQARTQTLTLRYERVVTGQTETLERDWVIHWVALDRFTDMAAHAGLRMTSSPVAIGYEPIDVVLRPR
jgi:SAM-dependent methyltransferase